MNREIKFRGKRIDNGEWVTGHYNEGSPNHHYITRPDGSVWLVDPKTVGQCTGTWDADEEEIYEHDILLNHDINQIQVVVWDADRIGWGVQYAHGEVRPLSEALGNLNTKTGNIYDDKSFQEEQAGWFDALTGKEATA